MKNLVIRENDTVNTYFMTHSGIFHADEVMATVILIKRFGNIRVRRTFKVPEKFSELKLFDGTLPIVYDIGGGKYDHHQRGGNGCRENGVPYASAGLIWRDFGRDVSPDTCPNKELVWSLVDRDLIQGIDAIDNGAMPSADYACKAMSISGVISSFNPTWNSSKSSDDCFEEAVEFAERIFDNVLESAMSKAEAEAVVETAIAEAAEGIMVLPYFVPWQEFVFSSENPKAKELLYVVFPSNRGGYNMQCVPVSLGSFASRKVLPENWCGLPASELQAVTGVATVTFCHNNGFMAATQTQEDAIKLAKLAAEA